MVICMKMLVKITIIIILINIICGSLIYQVKAVDILNGSTTNDYDPRNQAEIPKNQQTMNKLGKILGIIQVIGAFVCVGALMIIGIRSMIGSAEQKSVIKNSMPGYIVGVILLAGVTTLPSIIYNIVNSF